VGLAWFPAEQYERALEMWSSFAEDYEHGPYAAYCARLELLLRELISQGTPQLALAALAAQTGEPKLADRQWVMHSTAREAVESWEEIRDERNGLQYAVASWLTLALGAYLTALESGVEVQPMEIASG
jgi:hypothetical protein